MPARPTKVLLVMRTARFAFAFLLFAAISPSLSCGGSGHAASGPGSEILYVLQGGTVATYAVDPTSLVATLAEQPTALISAPDSILQFDPSPHDNFLYTVWSDAQNVQHLSVFQTDASGVPQIPATQTIDADSLSQFNMHPGGRFAYMLQVTNTNNEYFAKVRLFTVQPTGGTLKESGQLQGSYGPAPFWPAFLYGFSPDSNKLYISASGTTGSSVYWQRPINKRNGTLGASQPLITTNGNVGVAIGPVIVLSQQYSTAPRQGYIDIFPNNPNSRRSVHCTAQMLSFCGTATDVQLDRSGKHLFITDPVSSAIHVVRVSLVNHRLVDTGSSMPMTSQTPGFAFNSNGSIVYAMQRDGNLHFFHFDASSGALTEGGNPLPLAQGSGICPARHQ